MYPILLIFMMLFSCGMPIGDPTEEVLKTFQQKYPDVEEVKWNIDKNGMFEAKFKVYGEKYRADFLPTGKWIETENDLKYDHLPKAVRDAIERDFDKDDIEEIEQVVHHEKGIFYDVEFDIKGGKMDIEFNAIGQQIGKEIKL
jgi:SHS2 domain-containing protein